MQNKLDYFEAEVRRLEQKLTEQKLQYEKRQKELEEELAKLNDPAEEQKAEKEAPPKIGEEEVKAIDELVVKLEQEIAKINSSQDGKQEWGMAELTLQGHETVMKITAKLMGEENGPDKEAMQKLSSSLREATILFKKAEEKLNKKEEAPQ